MRVVERAPVQARGRSPELPTLQPGLWPAGLQAQGVVLGRGKPGPPGFPPTLTSFGEQNWPLATRQDSLPPCLIPECPSLLHPLPLQELGSGGDPSLIAG